MGLFGRSNFLCGRSGLRRRWSWELPDRILSLGGGGMMIGAQQAASTAEWIAAHLKACPDAQPRRLIKRVSVDALCGNSERRKEFAISAGEGGNNGRTATT